jgi:S1-C subfamily serine protease
MDVEAGEVAEDSGLLRGDVIVTVNGQSIDGTAAFEQAIAAARPAGRARLRGYNPQIEGYRMIALRLQ